MGVRVLEFFLNPAAPGWPEVDALVGVSRALGLRVSFHAPHKGPYQLTGFSGPERRRIEGLFEPVIDYAAAIAREDGPTPLVVHGAKGVGTRQELRSDTEAFLNWAHERAPDLQPALELRVREPDVIKVGDSKAELLSFVSQFSASRLGICWDLGHDARNGAGEAPLGFIARVAHVHVHDLAPGGVDHYPLLFDNTPYRDALQRLYNARYAGCLVFEVNGHLVARLARERSAPPMSILRHSFQRIVAAFSP
jgi:sugar phosphate isomerase/epimerase